ncbi:MAG: DUF2314 domain-containing protein [Alphaproteobacteria bacterium]|nr:DUF2314 domain-containing protein [Alphaproteobacteria bacterium]
MKADRLRKVATRARRFNRAAGLLLLSTGAAHAAPPAPPGDARGSVVLYCPTECGALELPGFAVRARLPRLATRPVLSVTPVAELSPPAADEQVWVGDPIELHGMGDAIVVSWAAPVGEARSRMGEVLAAVAAQAVPIEDLDTGRLYAPDALPALIAAVTAEHPDVAALSAVLVLDEDDGSTLLATRGLARLGLPELIDEQVSGEEVDPMAARLNAVAQALLEGAPLGATVPVDANAFRSDSARVAGCGLQGTASLAYGRGHADVVGDAAHAVLASFDGGFGECEGAAVAAAPAAATAADTLATVQARALTRLRGPVRDAAQAGLPSGERLLVKAPFPSSAGEIEWLWVEVQQWDGDDVLRGKLVSDPTRAANLKKGSAVKARVDVLFDYLWVKADGSQEGNTTQQYL